ncbi:MAG: hypothetical protein Q9187_007317 [Circinaria calcarea]
MTTTEQSPNPTVRFREAAYAGVPTRLTALGTWKYIFSKSEKLTDLLIYESNDYTSAEESSSQIVSRDYRGGGDNEEEEEQPLEPGRQSSYYTSTSGAIADAISGMGNLSVSESRQGGRRQTAGRDTRIRDNGVVASSGRGIGYPSSNASWYAGGTGHPTHQIQGLHQHSTVQQSIGYSIKPVPQFSASPYTSQPAGFSDKQMGKQAMQGYEPQAGALAISQTLQPYGNSATGGPEPVLPVADEISTVDGRQAMGMLRGTEGTFEKLDPAFKIEKDHWNFYVPGRVFKTLWWEPMGEHNLEQGYHGPSVVKYGEQAYAKVRRFIVIRAKPKEYYSNCIQISTHGGRGVARKGLNQEEHCIVYTSSKPPKKLEGETKMRKDPIHVRAISSSEKLDPLSRVNFSKVYPVEHNIKIKEIGLISGTDLKRLIGYWKNATQPYP